MLVIACVSRCRERQEAKGGWHGHHHSLALTCKPLQPRNCPPKALPGHAWAVLVLSALAAWDCLACARSTLQHTERQVSFKQRRDTSLKMEIPFLVLPHSSGDACNKLLLSQFPKNCGNTNFHWLSATLPCFLLQMFFQGIWNISALYWLKKKCLLHLCKMAVNPPWCLLIEVKDLSTLQWCTSQEFLSWIKRAVIDWIAGLVCGSCYINFLLHRWFWTAWKLFSCFMNKSSFDRGMPFFSMMFFNSVLVFHPGHKLVSLYVY